MPSGAHAGELAPGSNFGGYRIEAFLGRGGMAVVYRAEQLRPRRKVALKLIAPELAANPALRARFERESEAAARIDHPNVVPLYEVDEEGGQLYIAMRYVDGTDLRPLIAAPLAPARAATIVAQAAAALDAAHSRGLVHRDVKPANLLVSQPGAEDHVYLTDFGLALPLTGKDRLTRTGQWVGTVDYVAPEQIEGGTIDGRADVYSLACVLYHSLTAEVPFPRDSEISTMWAHLHDPPPAARTVAPDLPPALDEVLSNGMAKRPEDRYSSAGALGRAALAAAAGEPLPTPGEAGPAIATGATRVEDRSSTRSRTRTKPTWETGFGPARLRRPAAIAGTLIAAAAAIVAAIVLIGGSNGGPATVKVGAPIPVGRAPGAIAGGDFFVWVANVEGKSLSRIQPDQERTSGGALPIGGRPDEIATSDRNVWVADSEADVVRTVDPKTGRSNGPPIRVGNAPSDLAIRFGSVWVANYGDGTVTRIDLESRKVVGGPIPVGKGPTSVAAGAGAVWVSDTADGTVARIDPARAKVVGRPIPVGSAPGRIAVGAGDVWVANVRARAVTAIDPSRNVVDGAPVAVKGHPQAIAVGAGSVWVAEPETGAVERIDPLAKRVDGEPIAVGDKPAGLMYDFGKLWVTDSAANAVVSVTPTASG